MPSVHAPINTCTAAAGWVMPICALTDGADEPFLGTLSHLKGVFSCLAFLHPVASQVSVSRRSLSKDKDTAQTWAALVPWLHHVLERGNHNLIRSAWAEQGAAHSWVWLGEICQVLGLLMCIL